MFALTTSPTAAAVRSAFQPPQHNPLDLVEKLPDSDLVSLEIAHADALLKKFAERIESEMVDRMVNHMAAELATDIKQILSVQERREALRALAREHMASIMASTGKKT